MPHLPPPRTLGAALEVARQSLAAQSETSSLDAQLLLAAVLRAERAWVLAHSEEMLTADQARLFQAAVNRCLAGEALPYVLGRWDFFGRSFELTPEVLIPRPETELMVEVGLNYLAEAGNGRVVVDVGTGSGCVAVTLAAQRRGCRIIATDISRAALGVARRNARRHAVDDRIAWIQADLLGPVHGTLHLICANLPYVHSGVLRDLPVSRREPAMALDGGPDGLSLIRRLIVDLPRQLAPDGLALIEIEAGHGPQALAEACARFGAAGCSVERDLAGHDRLLVIRPRTGDR